MPSTVNSWLAEATEADDGISVKEMAINKVIGRQRKKKVQ